MQAAADFNYGFECKHLQVVQFAATTDSKPLNEKSIFQLHLMNIISKSNYLLQFITAFKWCVALPVSLVRLEQVLFASSTLQCTFSNITGDLFNDQKFR